MTDSSVHNRREKEALLRRISALEKSCVNLLEERDKLKIRLHCANASTLKAIRESNDIKYGYYIKLAMMWLFGVVCGSGLTICFISVLLP